MAGHLDRHPTKQISHELIDKFLTPQRKNFLPASKISRGRINCERFFEIVFKLIVDLNSETISVNGSNIKYLLLYK